MNELVQTEIFDFLTVKNLLIIVHLFGLALGAGAAFFSDFLFTEILKDRKFTADESRLLGLASKVVWIGLTVLAISGILIFLGDVSRYLDSTKFLAKMTIIGILLINGTTFHKKHLPLLSSYIDQDLLRVPGIQQQTRWLFISGGVSGVSWAAALILGSLSTVSWSYWTVMGLYLLAVLFSALAALGLNKYYFANYLNNHQEPSPTEQQQ